MSEQDRDYRDLSRRVRPHCCPCAHHEDPTGDGVSRRAFLGGVALGGMALTGLSWAALAAAEPDIEPAPPRLPLRVKPVFLYQVYNRRPQTSWRPWGGIQKQEDADQEVARIQGEMEKLKAAADFPVEFLPLLATRDARQVAAAADLADADVLLVYAANGNLNEIGKLGKDTIFFVRHKSGPVYLYYEIISPRYLRQHTDELKTQPICDEDVVVDSQDEILWRLRGLCGLKNTRNARIMCVGGVGAWAQPGGVVPALVRKIWNMELLTLSYPDLGKLVQEARQDAAAVALAKQRAEQYLKLPGTTLETDRQFVDNAFLLEQVFRKVMRQANCRMITVGGCMGTIMPVSETTACLPLSLLNDAGFLAFCESDFVVIPSGVLLAGISGRPVFLNDPTYPHDGVITLAHCTAPRKLDGQQLEPARILTHFESDYGAAPKVEMPNGQVVTNIIPDFKSERWVGLLGEIVDHPFLPICRSQIDIRYKCADLALAERMPGFHWMTAYGDYRREIGYALRRVGIRWEVLG